MKMKWNTYKMLSPSLQKEYDYRFSDDVTVPIRGLISIVSLMVAILVIFSLRFILLQKNQL